MSRPVCGAIFAASGASGEAGERPEDPRKAIVHQVDYGSTRVKAKCNAYYPPKRATSRLEIDVTVQELKA